MPRSQRELPEDHPLTDYELPEGTDCIADVPKEKLEELVEYYGDDVPEGEPIPRGRELV
jgi:hypothetical protein